MWRGPTIFWLGLGVQVATGIVIGAAGIYSLPVILILLQPGFWLTVIGAGAWAVEIGTRHLDPHSEPPPTGTGGIPPASSAHGSQSRSDPGEFEGPSVPEETIAVVLAELHAAARTRDELLELTGHEPKSVDQALEYLLAEREIAKDRRGGYHLWE